MKHEWYRAGELIACFRCRLAIMPTDKEKVAEHKDAECEDDGRVIADLTEEHFALIADYDQVDGDVTSSPR